LVDAPVLGRLGLLPDSTDASTGDDDQGDDEEGPAGVDVK
jgi:hypothetical protein